MVVCGGVVVVVDSLHAVLLCGARFAEGGWTYIGCSLESLDGQGVGSVGGLVGTVAASRGGSPLLALHHTGATFVC